MDRNNIKEKMSEKKKIITLFFLTTVFCFITSYVPNKLYTFSCFSHNDKRAIMTSFLLIDIVYSLIVSKLSGITFKDLGFSKKLFRRYLFMLLPGMLIQLLRICIGKCTLSTGVSEMFLYLLVAVSEEILFRGVVLALIFKISHSNKYSIIIQAIIFGLIHYPNASFGTLSSCFEPMFSGAIFACIRVFLPEGMGMPSAILLHWIWNMCL